MLNKREQERTGFKKNKILVCLILNNNSFRKVKKICMSAIQKY